MSERSYTATRLKAELLRVLDDVQGSGEPVLVTKHGRAVARLVPIETTAPLHGSVTFRVDDDELVRPLEERWDAEA